MQLARTVGAWEAEILAWHVADGCSTRPTEALGLLIKKVRASAELLAVVDQTTQPTRASLWLRPSDTRSLRTGT